MEAIDPKRLRPVCGAPRPGTGVLGFWRSPGLRFLLGGARGGLLIGLLQLKVFLVGIALLAGFAVFVGSHATLVGAFFASGGGLFAASLLFLRLIGGSDRTGQQRNQAPKDNQRLHQLHNLQHFALAKPPAWPKVARATVCDSIYQSDAACRYGIHGEKS
jgi:hypothetical protein